MPAYWIEFTGKPSGCVEADTEEAAKAIAAEKIGTEVKRVRRIPYPATPRINTVVHPQWGITPAFCFKPTECAGRTACPQRYSCTE